PALEQAGAKWFGVTSTDEGVVLREAGITGRILVLCGLYPGEEEDALRHQLTPAVFRLEDAQAVARAATRMSLNQQIPVHLKIDTGMARLGLPFAALESFADGEAPAADRTRRRVQSSGIVGSARRRRNT